MVDGSCLVVLVPEWTVCYQLLVVFVVIISAPVIPWRHLASISVRVQQLVIQLLVATQLQVSNEYFNKPHADIIENFLNKECAANIFIGIPGYIP